MDRFNRLYLAEAQLIIAKEQLKSTLTLLAFVALTCGDAEVEENLTGGIDEINETMEKLK